MTDKKLFCGFWNYVDTGVLDGEAAARDWAELGCNLAMSFEYHSGTHSKQQFLASLDACAKLGIKVIVCDTRTRFTNYIAKGVERFAREVSQAAADFAQHPAVYGFHVGDEPFAYQIDAAIDAYRIVKKAAPKLKPFINFFPYWDEADFDAVLGVKGIAGYEELLNRFVKEAGLEMLCYDYYGQCSYFEQQRFSSLYFQNLNLFGRVASSNNIPLWTSLLSVGHFGLRCPSEDDIRWQISTSLAYGCKGILWFFVYERRLDGSYRLPPIDLFWQRTSAFEPLSRQNRTLMQYYANKFDGMQLDCVRVLGKGFADTAPFKGSEFEIASIEHIINPDAPVIVSRFVRADGGISYLIVNAHQSLPARIRVRLADNEASGCSEWFAPGQMQLIEL